MLKNVFDYKGKREYQDGQVQLYDKIWIYGYNLKDPEIEFLIERFKLNRKFLKNIGNYTRPQILSKNPYTFIIHDFLIEKKAMQNNILFVVGENFVLTLMPNKISEYEKVLKETLDIDYFEIIRNILMKSLQTNYDVLDKLEDDIEKMEKKYTSYDKIKFLQKQLILMEGIFRKTIYFLNTGFAFRFNEKQKEFLDGVKNTFKQQIEVINKLQIRTSRFAKPLQPKKSLKKLGAVLIDLGVIVLIAAILLGLFVYPDVLSLIIGFALPEDLLLRIMIAAVAVLALSAPLYFFFSEWKD